MNAYGEWMAAAGSAGVAWTILRPHHFMQNLLDATVFDRKAGRVYSASGDGRIPFIDTRDIAAAAVATLTEDGHEGAVYTLTGPEAISYRDVTQILSRLLDRPLAYVPESEAEAWQRLREERNVVLWMEARHFPDGCEGLRENLVGCRPPLKPFLEFGRPCPECRV